MSEQKVKLMEEEMNVYRVQGFSCANCAGKFEKNVKKIPGVQDAKVNFGASKIDVFGSATVEELEKAGAFENLKVAPEKPKRRVEPVVIKDKNVYRVEGFSCANCAGKFEKNVKQIAGVEDAKVNFGASKIDVYGNASVEELEKAGAFENLKVIPEKLANPSIQSVKEDTKAPKEEKIPFYKKHSTLLFAT
ncbi:heavy-metal-associated domain-containing protein, partial [Macrococcoides bohemicum]